MTSASLPEISSAMTYKVDAMGHTRESFDGLHTLTWSYDDMGRPTQLQDSTRVWKKWVYGTANFGASNLRKGRLVRATRYNFPPGQKAAAIEETYQYSQGVHGVSSITRRLAWPDRVNPDGTRFRMALDYDLLGNVKQLDYPECLSNVDAQSPIYCNDGNDTPAPSHTATWTYARGLMTWATSSRGPEASFGYHQNLQLNGVTFGNGVTATYTEGTGGMVRPAQRTFKLGNTTLFGTGTYHYDAAGNIKRIGTDVYTYDGSGRLKYGTVKQAGSGRYESYTFDQYDNLTKITNDQGSTTLNVNTSNNRLKGMAQGANDWSYDAAGNATIYGSVATLSWDALSMQTEHSEGGVDYISVYGPGEYRAWVEDSSTGTRYWTMRGPSGQILSEYEVTDESGSVSWNHKRDLLRGAEGAVAAVYNNGDERYFHTDHLGTPRVLTNGNGSVVGRHHYYPFGDEVDQGIFSDGFESGDLSAWGANGNSDDLSIKFTGHQRELHRTSDYMLGRHYFVKPGRFASVDPARDGWNLYSYVSNNPLLLVDPYGRDASVMCEAGSCTATVRAQIVVDPSNPDTVDAANEFKQAAEDYWNNQSSTAPSGETVTFDVEIAVVSQGDEQLGMDTLTVVDAEGRSSVDMKMGNASMPDTGTIYTKDVTNNPSGMRGVAAHETGHLMGLRDLYQKGTSVPLNTDPAADIMKYGQATNGAPSAWWVISNGNLNSHVVRK